MPKATDYNFLDQKVSQLTWKFVWTQSKFSTVADLIIFLAIILLTMSAEFRQTKKMNTEFFELELSINLPEFKYPVCSTNKLAKQFM